MAMDTMGSPALRPRAAKVGIVAAYYGISRSLLYSESKAGRIQFLKLDGSTLIEFSEADRWFEERVRPQAA